MLTVRLLPARLIMPITGLAILHTAAHVLLPAVLEAHQPTLRRVNVQLAILPHHTLPFPPPFRVYLPPWRSWRTPSLSIRWCRFFSDLLGHDVFTDHLCDLPRPQRQKASTRAAVEMHQCEKAG